MKTIVIGCDNAAVNLKSRIIMYLEERGINVENVGCDSVEDDIKYPEVAAKVCHEIIFSGYIKEGILICGTGIGMAITANKFKGIRAAVCHDIFSAERAKLSNNANVLCLGERVIGFGLASKMVDEWIKNEFIDGPSTPKVKSLVDIEQENLK